MTGVEAVRRVCEMRATERKSCTQASTCTDNSSYQNIVIPWNLQSAVCSTILTLVVVKSWARQPLQMYMFPPR